MLPAEYHARCTNPECSWRVTTTQIDPRAYRDQLARQHTAHYGHTTTEQDTPS